jgi:hypothetical protein
VVIGTAISAMVVPKFGLFLSFSGAFACTGLAFILPVTQSLKYFTCIYKPFYSHYCIIKLMKKKLQGKGSIFMYL